MDGTEAAERAVVIISLVYVAIQSEVKAKMRIKTGPIIADTNRYAILVIIIIDIKFLSRPSLFFLQLLHNYFPFRRPFFKFEHNQLKYQRY